MIDYTKLVDALRCGLMGDDECSNSDCPYWSGLGCMDGQLMEDAADAIEALQAQLPKRGKWVREMNVYDEPFYHCSACGECFDSNRDDTHGIFNYCPNCGAKMEAQDG